MTTKQRWLFWLMRFYPPFLGAGIRVCTVRDDLRLIETEMKLHWWNRNYVGTHFGGSLFAMCDPFYMVMLVELLGRDYIVWDKAATIRFRRPGRGTMRARFEIPLEREQEIRAAADAEGKVEPVFKAEVLDQEGEVVAEVEKLLYVRRKDARLEDSKPPEGNEEEA
ncbi:MAG: DUF4442 domain-containing protein [Acidobacteriota bacterium]|nr:DUF4442 domain-containing protein [Acidobacteriota bacterium]